MLQYSQTSLETREFDSASMNRNTFVTVGFVLVHFVPGNLLQILKGFSFVAARYLRLCELTYRHHASYI